VSAAVTIAGTETRLMVREWALLVFAFVFPPLTLLVVAGAFGSTPDDGFDGLVPSEFYVASYLGVPIAAITLIGLPVALASYRERDVLRRFAAFGVGRRTVVAAQVMVCLGMIVVGALLVLAVAAPTSGIPTIHHPVRAVLGFAAGTAAMLLIGVALGLRLRSARSAQAIGLVLFFPMFLLSGGGPPPAAMGGPTRAVSNLLPLTHVVSAIRDPWLDDGSSGYHLAALATWSAIAVMSLVIGARASTDAG
jgi:ABC-2 type transport system permease protein